MTRLCIFGALICCAALAALPVLAHGWYDPACCSNQDCAPVPARSVTAVPGGWQVEVGPGDHPLIHAPASYFLPYEDALISQDGAFHLCVSQSTGALLCLYAPPMGM